MSRRSKALREVVLFLMAAWLGGACAKQPASIKVKLPRDALESSRPDPVPRPFTEKGQTITLRASAFDEKGYYTGPAAVVWSSSDPTVATVDEKGTVTILSSGECSIQANVEGAQPPLESSLAIRVILVGKVRISRPDPTRDTMRIGEVQQFSVEVLDDRGRPVSEGVLVHWRGGDYRVAVNPTGEVEAISPGETRVYVDAGGKGDSAVVKVLENP